MEKMVRIKFLIASGLCLMFVPFSAPAGAELPVACDEPGDLSCTGAELLAGLPPAHRPTVMPAGQASSPDAPVSSSSASSFPGSQYLGNDTCRYRGLYYANGGTTENDLFSATAFSATEGPNGEQRAHVIGNTRALGALPATNSANAYADADMIAYLEDWPQPSSVTITFPWRVRGTLSASAGFNPLTPATATTRLRLGFFIGRDDDIFEPSSTIHKIPVDEILTITSEENPETQEITKDGSTEILRSTPSDQFYFGFTRARVIVNATSNIGNDALAEAEFAREDLGHRSWTPYQDWKFNLPSGWEIASC